MNHLHITANVRQRHAKPWQGTNGYYVACGLRDGLYALSLTGLFAILLSPLAYALNAA